MRKDLIIGSVALFVLWGIMDFIIHGMLLGPTYASTAALWRPMAEMKLGLSYVTTAVAAVCFTLIYTQWIAGAPMHMTLAFGMYFGIAAGMSMGFGTYSVMPIPFSLAVSWLVATLVESVAGALLLHWVCGRFRAAS